MATELDNEFLLQKRYLNFPVSNGAPLRFISVIIDDQVVRDFGIELAPDKPDYWVFLDVSQFRGKKAILRIDRYDPIEHKGFDAVRLQ